MTRLELQQNVINNTGRTDKISVINGAILQAVQEIGQYHDFKRNKVQFPAASFVAGSRTFTLPSDCFQVLNVRLWDTATTPGSISRIVRLMDKTPIIRRFPNELQNVSGWPAVCYVDDDGVTLTFLPPSTENWFVVVEYFRFFTGPTTDDAIAPAQLEYAIESWVTAKVFRSTQQFIEADKWMAEYVRTLQAAVGFDKRQKEEKSMRPFSQTSEATAVIPPYLDPFSDDDGSTTGV